MAALGYDADLVRPEPMPSGETAARDRSLDSERFADPTGLAFHPVGQTLARE
jgi:hypothetical protein